MPQDIVTYLCCQGHHRSWLPVFPAGLSSPQAQSVWPNPAVWVRSCCSHLPLVVSCKKEGVESRDYTSEMLVCPVAPLSVLSAAACSSSHHDEECPLLPVLLEWKSHCTKPGPRMPSSRWVPSIISWCIMGCLGTCSSEANLPQELCTWEHSQQGWAPQHATKVKCGTES